MLMDIRSGFEEKTLRLQQMMVAAFQISTFILKSSRLVARGDSLEYNGPHGLDCRGV